MLFEFERIDALGVVDRAVIFDDGNNGQPCFVHQAGSHTAHVPEALDNNFGFLRIQAEALQRLQGDNAAAAACRCWTPARAAQVQGLACHNGSHRVALVHRVGIHDPGHGLLVGIHVRGRYIALRAQDVHQFGGVAPRDALQLARREHLWIADYAALSTAKRNVNHGAFPSHPGREGAHFVERDVGSKTNAALGWAAGQRVLHPVAGEHLQPPVIEADRNVNGHLHRRTPQDLGQAIVQPQSQCGFIEARLGGEPWIKLTLQRNVLVVNVLDEHRRTSAFIMVRPPPVGNQANQVAFTDFD